jgi:phenylpyruvate tautomerase PptA (4-oxalocrotonate tautomerase family)
MEPAMPVIRVTCPENVLTAQQKEQFAPLLIDAVMTHPVTDVARNATFLVYNEVPQQNCFMGNEPFWLVEAMTAAGFFTQERRDRAQTAIAKAFLKVLGDDGSSVVLGGVRIAPAYLMRVYCLLIEIPEGSWGATGHGVSALEIGHMIGSDKDPQRWSELKVTTAKLQAARAT